LPAFVIVAGLGKTLSVPEVFRPPRFFFCPPTMTKRRSEKGEKLCAGGGKKWKIK